MKSIKFIDKDKKEKILLLDHDCPLTKTSDYATKHGLDEIIMHVETIDCDEMKEDKFCPNCKTKCTWKET
jgi:hypothetical protein